WSTSLSSPTVTWIVGSLAFAVAAWTLVALSSGSDLTRRETVPVAVDAQDRRALPTRALERPADVVAPAQDTPVESRPRPEVTTRAETSTEDVAAG
ncbi:MAG TPA: hypothetical protein VFK68_12565, partial [Propionibacteriaceae bacterium]|nr:hypothetical protein [Propionibacteriaceae bacterium]